MLVSQSPGSMIGEELHLLDCATLTESDRPLYSSAPECFRPTLKYLTKRISSKLPRTKMSYFPPTPNYLRDNNNALIIKVPKTTTLMLKTTTTMLFLHKTYFRHHK